MAEGISDYLKSEGMNESIYRCKKVKVRSAEQLAAWLLGCSIILAWLPGCWTGYLLGCLLLDWLLAWLPGCWTGYLFGCLVDRLVTCLVGWLFYRKIGWSDKVNGLSMKHGSRDDRYTSRINFHDRCNHIFGLTYPSQTFHDARCSNVIALQHSANRNI
uniref:Uncharacterized protein n=1 Tax=Setaria digitata TaxID=48799 RepID=A0A915PUT1_9BILA